MDAASARDALAGTEKTSLANSAVNGFLYAVLAVPATMLAAPHVRHPLLRDPTGALVGIPVDSVVPVFAVLGPPVVFGLRNRGLLPAFVFVFPAAHALYLFLSYAPSVLVPVRGFGGPPTTPYLHAAILSVVVTLVFVIAGYAWGRGSRLLYEEFAAE